MEGRRGRDRIVVPMQSRQSVRITTNVVISNPAQSRYAPVSSVNKTDLNDITEILIKVSYSTITLTLYLKMYKNC